MRFSKLKGATRRQILQPFHFRSYKSAAYRRRIAGSSSHGTFVAPSTRTPSWLLPMPCICTRNSFLIRRVESLSPSDLLEHSESISSMKIIAGFFSRAISKRFFTSLVDSAIAAGKQHNTPSIGPTNVNVRRAVLFALALPLGHQTRGRNGEERGICLRCDGLGEVGFTRTRRLRTKQINTHKA
jgi:hypothetical protein